MTRARLVSFTNKVQIRYDDSGRKRVDQCSWGLGRLTLTLFCLHCVYFVLPCFLYIMDCAFGFTELLFCTVTNAFADKLRHYQFWRTRQIASGDRLSGVHTQQFQLPLFGFAKGFLADHPLSTPLWCFGATVYP